MVQEQNVGQTHYTSFQYITYSLFETVLKFKKIIVFNIKQLINDTFSKTNNLKTNSFTRECLQYPSGLPL